jgi:hypothetical protein
MRQLSLHRALPALVLLMLALTITGCLEVRQSYTLNPDGGGKVTIESTVKPFMLDEKQSKKAQATKFVQDVIDNSEGVDVWSDISCTALSGGKIHFKGTAYFRDMNALKLEEISMLHAAMVMEDGTMAVEIKGKNGSDSGAETGSVSQDAGDSAIEKVQLSEEDLAVKIDSLKEQFKMAQGMLNAIIGEMRDTLSIRFPGPISTVEGFTRNADGSATFTFNGAQMMQIFDSLTASPEFWRKMALEDKGSDPHANDAEMMRKLFGYEKPRALATPGATPLFDYAAEVAAAKKKYPALLKRYGVKK